MFLHSLRQIEDAGKELDTRLVRPIWIPYYEIKKKNIYGES
jgi:hypothetical protein